MKRIIAIIMICVTLAGGLYVQKNEVKANVAIAAEVVVFLLQWVAMTELINIAQEEGALSALATLADTDLLSVTRLWDQSSLSDYKDQKATIMAGYHDQGAQLYGAYTEEYYRYLFSTFFGIYADGPTRNQKFQNYIEYEKKLTEAWYNTSQKDIASKVGDWVPSVAVTVIAGIVGGKVLSTLELMGHDVSVYTHDDVVDLVLAYYNIQPSGNGFKLTPKVGFLPEMEVPIDSFSDPVKAIVTNSTSVDAQSKAFSDWYKQNVLYADGKYRFTSYDGDNFQFPNYHYVDRLADGLPYVPPEFQIPFKHYTIDFARMYLDAKLYHEENYGFMSGSHVFSGNELLNQPELVRNLFRGKNTMICTWVNDIGITWTGFHAFIADKLYTDIKYNANGYPRRVFYIKQSDLTVSQVLGDSITSERAVYKSLNDASEYLPMYEDFANSDRSLTTYPEDGFIYVGDDWGMSWSINSTTVDVFNLDGSLYKGKTVEKDNPIVSLEIISTPAVNSDGEVKSVVTGVEDVPLERDEDGTVVIPGDLGGDLGGASDLLDGNVSNTDGEQALRDIADTNTSIYELLKAMEQARTDAESKEIENQQTEEIDKKPAAGLPFSLPNLFALLGLILINILLLFVKGFVIVGLIFKIPATSALFNDTVVDAIERTRTIQLGQFNLSIVELLSWIVMFVFTFMLLKTLNKHLSKFHVT